MVTPPSTAQIAKAGPLETRGQRFLERFATTVRISPENAAICNTRSVSTSTHAWAPSFASNLLQPLTCSHVCTVHSLTHKEGGGGGRGGRTSKDAGSLESGGGKPGVGGVLLDSRGAAQAAVPALVSPRTVLSPPTTTPRHNVCFNPARGAIQGKPFAFLRTQITLSRQGGPMGNINSGVLRDQVRT